MLEIVSDARGRKCHGNADKERSGLGDPAEEAHHELKSQELVQVDFFGRFSLVALAGLPHSYGFKHKSCVTFTSHAGVGQHTYTHATNADPRCQNAEA